MSRGLYQGLRLFSYDDGFADFQFQFCSKDDGKIFDINLILNEKLFSAVDDLNHRNSISFKQKEKPR